MPLSAGTHIEQSFTVSVFIGGIKDEDTNLVKGDNPVLNGLTHNRTRLLSCKQVRTLTGSSLTSMQSTVKSFYFVGTKFFLMMMKMFVDK